MNDWIIHLIEGGGYWGIAFLMVIENVFPPIPSEVIMGLGGIAVARELGTLSLGLRSLASVEDTGPTRTVLARDLAGRQLFIARRSAPVPAPQRAAASPAPAAVAMPPRYYGPTMTVYRKGKPTDYEVRHVF